MVFGLGMVGTIALVAVGVPVLLFLARFVVAYTKLSTDDAPAPARDDFWQALGRSGRWLTMLFAGLLGAMATGLVGFGEFLDLATQFVSGHPFAVANVGTISLGALGLGGLVDLTPSLYVGLALGIVGFVLVVSEVRD